MPKTTRYTSMYALRRWFVVWTMALGVFVFVGSSVGSAAVLSFGFGSSDRVLSGMVVSVDPGDADRLVPANINNTDYVTGIAVDESSSTLVFDSQDTVYVATEGTTRTFVSTQGGNITNGDLVVVSSIAGVAQRKDLFVDGEKIIGVAKQDFNDSSANTQTVNLENAGEVTIGLIDVELLVSKPTAGASSNDDTNVLVRISQRIVGKPVSLTQVMMTTAIILVSFVIGGVMLFGAIKGSFISIGRNPLSANSIFSGMMRTSFLSVAVMVVGILGGYFVLIL